MTNYFELNENKVVKKWTPVLEKMGIKDTDKQLWMSEYAEYHNMFNNSFAIRENAYGNVSNTAGMGSVTSPQPSLLPGTTIGTNWSDTGKPGSGDLGQNLLPVSMKIAAQTPGLDLVGVKPSPGPKIDLVFIDFQYDDTNLGVTDERPTVFKLNTSLMGTTASTLTGTISTILTATSILLSSGGLTKADGTTSRIWTRLDSASFSGTYYTTSDPAAAGSSVANVAEFLGYSRIDGYPMFRAYKQANTAQTNSYPYVNNTTTGASGVWGFDQTRNTFNPTASMISQIQYVFGVGMTTPSPTIELISALEDHIPGFVSNFNQGGKYPMDRAMEENVYMGQMGPKITTKSIAIGSIEISSQLRRTEIEDIKANTGMDIVQKMESVLVNELSQTISKQIVSKIFEMGGLNRASAPAFQGTATIANQTVFDLDTIYVQSGPGGETTHAVQRKLITKMLHASTYLATEGRVGPAQFAVTNGSLATSLMDIVAYTTNPVKSKMNTPGQLYPIGEINGIQIYVDPNMKFGDNRIVIGRKNNPDQPGILFVPYLMAQSISLISEATAAPRLFLRSRYAIAECGWYPQKQYMTIVVKDSNSYIN